MSPERPFSFATETPPRTWGRRLRRGAVQTSDRNTPTHVGKTTGEDLRHSDQEKHPHARGEDKMLLRLLVALKETPPRTWGRLPVNGQLLLLFGNTPTHVGKTNFSRRRGNMFEKHPHARGEDPPWAPCWLTRWETPPRTWGRLGDGSDTKVLSGNTPTHVGKTEKGSNSGMSSKKHPHARGEDRFVV